VNRVAAMSIWELQSGQDTTKTGMETRVRVGVARFEPDEVATMRSGMVAYSHGLCQMNLRFDLIFLSIKIYILGSVIMPSPSIH
jgi:hypothetical protein